ncbi:prolyl oligopeptidase family serine peptidase [Candidatus Microgenomates bacterium]|nr:prolyl oligopeptidase family serine peptidase [Candidatus Microgenomates bacterium]
MKKIIIVFLFLFFLLLLFFLPIFFRNNFLIKKLGEGVPKPKPLMVYSFQNLQKTKFPKNQITLGRLVEENPDFLSQMFYFSVPEKPGSDKMKKVSGLLNVPTKPGEYPVLIMFRGFAPKEIFFSGIGTSPSAKIFTQNGFITLAPDFLGFGESDAPSENGFEDRFQTYLTALTLLSSLETLNTGLEASYSGEIKADDKKVGVWGHSNGGQIALSVLAISGLSYPTVLWAPVSKSFPYSILYYTDEFDDQGKSLRKFLAGFEEEYDTELFSPPNYYEWIKASLEIHQGASDQEVPVWWSDELVDLLKKDNIEVNYIVHPNSDHNLRPDGWNGAVLQSLEFYKKHFNNTGEL